MEAFEVLHARRLDRWRQTPHRRIAGPDEARTLIAQLGLATLYPVSPEIPNLFSAFVGDAGAKTDSNWDSPSGEVYTWRWTLGRADAAFYTALVRKRPTWIAWELLPAALRLFGDLRTPDELVDMRVISPDAYRVARALEDAGGALATGALRAAAGFPTGKEQRTAYLKAVEELDTRMLLAKVFPADGTGEDMAHALVATRYPQHVAAAERLARTDALDQLLAAYLASAVYALPAVLAKHLKLPESELRDGLERLRERGQTKVGELAGQKGVCYVWRDAAASSSPSA